MSDIGFYPMAENSLDIENWNTVDLACVDPNVQKRELDWYVKVEERRP